MSKVKKIFNFFMSGGAIILPGYTYLTQSAKLFYDFTTLSGADGAAITSVTDLSPSLINASNESPAQSPVIQYAQIGKDLVKCFKGFANSGTTSKDVLIANTTGDALFKSDFEILWVGALPSGVDRDIFGVANGTNILRVNLTTQKLRVEYRYSAATARRFVVDTPSSFFQNTDYTGFDLYRLRFDFTNDIFKFYYNGVDITMTSLVDAFSLIDPTKWANNTYKLCIGGYNNGGTIGLYGNYHLMSCFAVTPLLSSQEAIDVSDYLINNYTAA